MKARYQQLCFSIILCSIYAVLLYFILTHHQKLDFSSFYSTVCALIQGENPYKDLTAAYLPANQQLSANLNPPVVLWLFKPLAYLNYSTALCVWSAMSLLFGFIGAVIVFRYAFSARFLHHHYLNVVLLYFAFFATLMNVTTLQLGNLLFLLLMLGYSFYWHQRDYLAGICWGMIIAIKLFPALLFFYVLKQQRFKVFSVMLGTFIIACFIPVWEYGLTIYQQYYAMMSGVLWYGDGWNASLYGFICRLLIYSGSDAHLLFIKILYLGFFCLFMLCYLNALGPNEQKPINHQPFCLTLAMMLFLSPLGWVYYFPILILPLVLTWFNAQQAQNTKIMLLWLLCFFLLNFPLDYVKTQHMADFWQRAFFFSGYFYGLLLLIYLLITRKRIYGHQELQVHAAPYPFMPVIRIILAFGLSVPLLCFVMRLFQLDLHWVGG